MHYPVSGGGLQVEIPSRTSIEIIKSRTIAERVVQKLHLDEKKEEQTEKDDSLYGNLKSKTKTHLRIVSQFLKYGRFIGEMSDFEKAVKDFQDNISLESTKETYLFKITYEANDSETPVQVANTAAEVFIEYMVERNGDTARTGLALMKDRLRESGEELKHARDALKKFKENNKVVSFKEELSEKIKILASLETSLEKEETDLAGLLKKYTPDNAIVKEILEKRRYLLSSIEKRRKEPTYTPEMERKIAELELNVHIKESNYDLINKEFEQARIREANKTGEFMIASKASASIYPTGPVRIKYVIAALFLAFIMVIGLILLLESTNTTINTIEQAENQLQTRVLATIQPMK